MEIPGLELLSRNRGAAVGASATDWQTRIYANRRESPAEESVRLWEAAIPKLNEKCTVDCTVCGGVGRSKIEGDRALLASALVAFDVSSGRDLRRLYSLRYIFRNPGVGGSGALWPGCRRPAYRTIDDGCFC